MEPALPKSLRILRATQNPLTVKEIADQIQEDPPHVEKVLEELSSRNIVARSGKSYRYDKNDKNDEMADKVLAVYEKIAQRARREQLVVGILSAASDYNWSLRFGTLCKTLEYEGIESEGLDISLHEANEEGSIGWIRIACVSKEKITFPVPPFLPLSYVIYLRRLEPDVYETFREQWFASGLSIWEEDYLIGNYPPHQYHPAMQNIDKELKRMRARVEQEAHAFRQEALGFFHANRSSLLPSWPLANPDGPSLYAYMKNLPPSANFW
ncbi:MAG: hypothetical protein SVY53_13855 [Chloroflexota bacterium]|nr:hypothetical protein [Chloroflexota bacterium]